MKFKLLFLEDSHENLQEGMSFYQQISPDLAQKFLFSIQEKLTEIQKNPLHFQVRYRSIRIAHLQNFPFSIHYYFDHPTIYILRILNQKRLYVIRD